jgi:hypothetical protein
VIYLPICFHISPVPLSPPPPRRQDIERVIEYYGKNFTNEEGGGWVSDDDAEKNKREEHKREDQRREELASAAAAAAAVGRAFPSWKRSILTEIDLCHACASQEILRMDTPGRRRDARRRDSRYTRRYIGTAVAMRPS